jgi:hypothetical protein
MAVAVNKAYADDSRPNERIWAIAGYMGHDLQWEYFKIAWQKMLDKHDVPYLHMKEMAKPNGVYKKWNPPKEHEQERISFFKDLTSVISESFIRPFCSIVRIDDLKRFNLETGMKLEPYPLAAYGCMTMLSRDFEGIPVEITFDRVEKISSKLQKAAAYAENDTYYPETHKQIIPIPLPQGITWRQVEPLQASDFLVWEMQRQHLSLEEWFLEPDKPVDENARNEHMDNWSLNRYGNIRPPARKSLESVVDNGPSASVIIWTYENLISAHTLRNGVW